MNWHTIGWRRFALADAYGRVLAQVEDGATLALAYVTGRGLIGSYLNIEYAKAAAEKAVRTPEVPNAN